MVTITLKCSYCGSDKLVRDGRTPNGKQPYWCHHCHRSSRDHPQPRGYTEAEKEQILAAYEERSSLRGLERVFGVSRKTVSAWLKKRSCTPRLEHDLSGAGGASHDRVGT